MATLELRDLHKSFGPDPVVRGVDLDADDGELLVLVGPSGCGKSTILRIIAGLDSPDAGEVLLDGVVQNDREPRERDVAMVFQSYALYPHLTALENIAFPLRMAKVGASERRERARAAAERLGIADALGRKPAQLSGGQQQRVALARALVRRPRLFLLDEPLSNVDARLRAEMRAELKRLHRELGATMVYVTHDQVEAMTLGTRIAVLHEGRLQQVGPPLEVYERPANRFVAEFIGAPAMNVLTGAARLALAPDAGDAAVGFRPHDITLCDARSTDGLEVRVEVVEALGDQTLVHGVAGSERVVLSLPPGGHLSMGDVARVGVARDRLHLFDPASGARVR